MSAGTFQRPALAALFLFATSGFALAQGKTVRDWTAMCDQSETCITETVGSGGLAMGGQGYRLQIGRHAGNDTAWFMRFIMKNVPRPKDDGSLELTIDSGEPFPLSQDYGYLADADGMTFGIGNTLDLDRLFKAFKKGKSLALSFDGDDGQHHAETFSLSGSVATMLWIDEQQKRIGNSGEIGSPTGVTGEAEFTAATETAEKIKALAAPIDCSRPEGVEPTLASYHLPGGKALHIYSCFSGPYNFSHLFYVVRRGGEIAPILFADYADDYGWLGTDQLFNYDFDPKSGWLHSFYKSRGLGDCGSTGTWVWNNDLFRLLEFRAWDECDESRMSDDWPVVFTYKRPK